MGWLGFTFLLVVAAALALVAGVPATWTVATMLAGSLAIALLAGGRLARRAINAVRARGEQQALAAEARFGAGIARAHDSIRVERHLRNLAAQPGLDKGLVAAAERAVAKIGQLQTWMEESRLRPSRADALPLGGHASNVLEQIGGSLKPYSRTPRRLLPTFLRGAGDQFSIVLDEVRVLHSAEVERSVLLFTLVARAVLVSMAPLLGAWTQADTPLLDTGPAGGLAWAAVALISLATMAMAPRIVDTVMRDTDAAQRFRGKLLLVEVPVFLVSAPLLPAWTVVIFAVGWTNWWQRQTPRLEFDWAKLSVFVATVVALQSAGLASQGLSASQIAVEVLAALLAIAVIGGSYGAMLPLAVATVVAVVVGDGARSIRSANKARSNLLACARQLRSTASQIDAAGPDIPLALNAATLSRQAAEKLEREADLFARRGLLAPQILSDLFDQAIGASNLCRSDAVQLDLQRRAAAEQGEPEPAFAMEPLLDEIATAHLAKQRHARILRSFLVTAYNEASVHGTSWVRASAALKGDRLSIQIANLPRPDSTGIAGVGGRRLHSLAGKLPDGEIMRSPGLRAAAELGLPGDHMWWTVELSVSAEVIREVMQY